MTWHLFQIGKVRHTTLPAQIAKIASILNHTTDVRLRVQYRNHDSVMFCHQIHDTHNTRTADYTHILVDTIRATLVNCHQVAGFIDTIRHYLSRNQTIVSQQCKLVTMVDAAILGHAHETVGKFLHLLFEICIALCQFLVHLGK